MKHKLPSKLIFLGLGILIAGICIGFVSSKISNTFFSPKILQSIPTNAVYSNAEKEPDDTFAQASPLVPGYETIGTFSNSGDVDMYKFSIDNPATAKIALSNVPSKYKIFVYNDNHELIAFADRNGFTGSTSLISLSESGKYYIKLQESASDKQINVPYTITLDILPFAD